MKALGSAVSVTLHVAVGIAVLFGTTKTVRSDPGPVEATDIFFPTETYTKLDPGMGGPPLPGPIAVAPPRFDFNPGPATISAGVVPRRMFSPAFSPNAGPGPGGGQATSWDGAAEAHAEVLSGPLPFYPELLRQAGVQGRVVLEATVDTTGRILPASIRVVLTTNPGFVAPARQALLATLFRPAMVGDKPVQMRVRIPYEFAIRNGPGQTR